MTTIETALAKGSAVQEPGGHMVISQYTPKIPGKSRILQQMKGPYPVTQNLRKMIRVQGSAAPSICFYN